MNINNTNNTVSQTHFITRRGTCNHCNVKKKQRMSSIIDNVKIMLYAVLAIMSMYVLIWLLYISVS